jgi:uncharacterized protein YggU (UPF0235/DUF167 family)
VRLIAGATARTKVVEIDCVDEDAARRRWPGLA